MKNIFEYFRINKENKINNLLESLENLDATFSCNWNVKKYVETDKAKLMAVKVFDRIANSKEINMICQVLNEKEHIMHPRMERLQQWVGEIKNYIDVVYSITNTVTYNIDENQIAFEQIYCDNKYISKNSYEIFYSKASGLKINNDKYEEYKFQFDEMENIKRIEYRNHTEKVGEINTIDIEIKDNNVEINGFVTGRLGAFSQPFENIVGSIIDSIHDGIYDNFDTDCYYGIKFDLDNQKSISFARQAVEYDGHSRIAEKVTNTFNRLSNIIYDRNKKFNYKIEL